MWAFIPILSPLNLGQIEDLASIKISKEFGNFSK